MDLTITGSIANIIVVERARKEAAITFFDYFRIGRPVTVLTLLLGWLWSAIVFISVPLGLGSTILSSWLPHSNLPTHHAKTHDNL